MLPQAATTTYTPHTSATERTVRLVVPRHPVGCVERVALELVLEGDAPPGSVPAHARVRERSSERGGCGRGAEGGEEEEEPH